MKKVISSGIDNSLPGRPLVRRYSDGTREVVPALPKQPFSQRIDALKERLDAIHGELYELSQDIESYALDYEEVVGCHSDMGEDEQEQADEYVHEIQSWAGQIECSVEMLLDDCPEMPELEID